MICTGSLEDGFTEENLTIQVVPDDWSILRLNISADNVVKISYGSWDHGVWTIERLEDDICLFSDKEATRVTAHGKTVKLDFALEFPDERHLVNARAQKRRDYKSLMSHKQLDLNRLELKTPATTSQKQERAGLVHPFKFAPYERVDKGCGNQVYRVRNLRNGIQFAGKRYPPPPQILVG